MVVTATLPLVARTRLLLYRLMLACGLAIACGCATDPVPRQTLQLATGASGGAFQEYGPGVAKVVGAHAPLDLQSTVTAGSNENLQLLADGKVAVALVNMGPTYEAWSGTEAWRGKQIGNIRALVPMYETPFHMIALRASGIATLRQLDGKRVGVGPVKGPAENFFRGLAEAIGIHPVLVNGSPSDNAQDLLHGRIDAFWYGAGLPVGAFAEVARAAPTTVFGLAPDEIAAFRTRYPYLAPYAVPARTYAGQDADIHTVAVWNFILARDDLGDATAYAMVKAILDHPGEIASAYPAAAATVTANAKANTFLPFHPGAARYYREHAVVLAPQLMP
jgi:TRAP transporter TAXI family solute receptor